jgi:hypothetical protein
VKIHRSAETGRLVTAEFAAANPDTTTTEEVTNVERLLATERALARVEAAAELVRSRLAEVEEASNDLETLIFDARAAGASDARAAGASDAQVQDAQS